MVWDNQLVADRSSPRFGDQAISLPPGLRNDFLSLPIPGAHFTPGDAVPTIRPTFMARTSGLLVPVQYARSPVPLDSVATYLTSEEIVGTSISFETTVDHLTRLPLLETLRFCAGLLWAVDRPGFTQAQVDALLLDVGFVPPVRRRLRALLADGTRVLVVPQILLVLIKCAVRLSGDCLVPGVEPGSVVHALLGVGDNLERSGDVDSAVGDEELVVGTGVPGRLEREVVSIHHFHRQTDLRHLVAMFIRRWTQLPTELADDPRVVDLAAEFHAAVGVSLEEFIAAGIALHATVVSRGPVLPRDLLTQAGLDDRAAEVILQMVTSSVAELRAWAQNPANTSPWEFSHFEQFPILDCGDHLLVIRPDLVLRRFFGWLPLFDVQVGLGERGAARSRVKRVQGCVEHLGEVYTAETLQAQARRHGLRLFTEAQLRAALNPGPGRKVCDLSVDDGRRWAVFEVTSSRLTRESVANTSPEQLDSDFAKLLGKVRQLDATITSLRAREPDLTEQPAPTSLVRRRYFPVLVLTEGFPVNPITLTMLRQRAEQAGLLRGDDVEDLEVVDVTELEMLEGAGFGELTVLDALEAKSRAALQRANLRDFLLREHRLTTTAPDRVKHLAHEAYQIALRQAPAGAA